MVAGVGGWPGEV
jgi:hypothetical protein